MDLLHEYCEGYVEILDPENYGRCEKCDEEGLFHVVRESDDNIYVIFDEVVGAAIGLPLMPLVNAFSTIE